MSDGTWFTLELKNEEAITAALGNKFAGFMDAEKKQTARVAAHAKSIQNIIIVTCLGVFIICMAALIYLLIHRNPFR
jgi:Trk-type K+ transport system membrane component